MAPKTVTILCGKCRVGVEGPAEPQDHDMLACPSCGRTANFKKVMASVMAFSEELMAEAFHKTLANSLRNSKVIKVTGKGQAKKSYPFVSDMKF